MKRMTLLLVLFASALSLAACGSSKKATPAGNPTDRAFVSEMIPHHKSAVAMAQIAQARASSPFVKTLAANIIRTQTAEITEMQTQDAVLAKDGVTRGQLGVSMSAMGMNMNTSSLKTANPFDPAFLRMMLPHHAGAITMAKIELAKGEDPALKKLATQIISAQQREITEMNANL